MYEYLFDDKNEMNAALDLISKYCYIWTNKDCNCHMKEKTIVFKSRAGKKFDIRLKKYCDILGLQITNSTNYFDYSVYVADPSTLSRVQGYLDKRLSRDLQ